MTNAKHTSGARLRKNKIQSSLSHRQLKVREGYHSYQLNQRTPLRTPLRTPVGQIELKGHWLIQAGFNINSAVTVRVMEGCLVLTCAAADVGKE